MSKNFYNILWVDKNSNVWEIKKAYRKQAMKYHPDRNKWDLEAENKFKEVNEAYSVLSDDSKRKQYDTFWSTSWNPFWWWSSQSYSSSWFEDLFWSSFWWWKSNSAWWINIEDLFWGFSGWSYWWSSFWGSSTKRKTKFKTEPISLDFEKIYEVPIFDLILGCSIEVRWVYWTTVRLKIPPSTNSWSKFRVKWFWKKELWKQWNLIVKIEALMPKNISDVDKSMLERIRENVGY